MMPSPAKIGCGLCRDLAESVKPEFYGRPHEVCACGDATGIAADAARLAHSSVCTGGAFIAAGAAGLAIGAAGLAWLAVVATRASFSMRADLVAALPAPSALAPRTRSFDACRRWRAGPDRSMPQERAIAGPAE